MSKYARISATVNGCYLAIVLRCDGCIYKKGRAISIVAVGVEIGVADARKLFKLKQHFVLSFTCLYVW